MLPLYGFLVLIYHTSAGLTAPATYDQRQTGDLNVQVHLKDVHVLALLDKELLDDYTDYDYFYDYPDFTVKPSEVPVKPTPASETSSPSSDTTVEPDTVELADSDQNSTSSLSSVSPVLNSTESTSAMGSEKSNESTTEKTGDNISENVKTRNMLPYYNSGGQHSELSSQGNSAKLMRKRCRSGYSPDGKGRCRRSSQRRLSLIPIAMKLGPKFLNDLTRNTKNQP
ncbi:uncharacterized protein LOC116431709 [Nomia melanderi]|uniref:uncharacterized protein LOC116431709 n=1 Tax=Nomia melanderi TaxID=2448451 RepID=UPI00130466A4|nr:uncharacterized protein LOC116431709 [Nomia melanderi]